MTDIDEYPNPKKALLGNGHVANLRCAIKWTAWQLIHVLFLLVLLVAVTAARVYKPVGDWIHGYSVSERTKEIVGYVLLGGIVLWFVGVFTYLFLVEPLLALAAIGFPLAVFGLLFGFDKTLPYIDPYMQKIASVLGIAAKRSKETPGVRRIYGGCPVSFDIEPKWFDRVTERFK